jgi:hypothetical protein
MTGNSVMLAQSRVVGFFVILCLSAVIGVVRGLILGTRFSLGFIVAQSLFIFSTAAASWYLYQSKKAGWYLSVLVVLNWFLKLASARVGWNFFASLVSVGMIIVLLWLFLPKVKAHFDLKA